MEPAIRLQSPISRVLLVGMGMYLVAAAAGSLAIGLLYYLLGSYSSSSPASPIEQSVTAAVFAFAVLIGPGAAFAVADCLSLGLLARRRPVSRPVAVGITSAIGLAWFALLFGPSISIAGLRGTDPAVVFLMVPWVVFGMLVRDRVGRFGVAHGRGAEHVTSSVAD